MAAPARQPNDPERRVAMLAEWDRVQQELDEAQADLTDAEREAIVKEITDAIGERLCAHSLDRRDVVPASAPSPEEAATGRELVARVPARFGAQPEPWVEDTMSAGAVRPRADDELDPVAAWRALRERVGAAVADLSDDERQALADEISAEVDRAITARLRPEGVS